MGVVPLIGLNNGVRIPQLGFGVFQVPQDQVAGAVRTALDAGYRSIDTASAYGNESGVGDAIAATDIPRDELFITTKLWNSDQGYDSTLRAFESSMRKLRLDVLDLYLIHWPTPARNLYVDTWKALEKLYADGRVRAIGVSNFHTEHLQRLFDSSDVTPAVNQIELHPLLAQEEMRKVHVTHRIATEAWSPLARGGELLHDTAIRGLADKYAKTPAQIVLRWHVQLGNVVIPKSVTPYRIKENIEVFDFELAPDDMAVINELDNGTRTGPDPDRFNSA
ncbi:oxidoreductase [Lentzea sp. NBRC 105346]|uniref:aldo/keto reductase n=1 Tax=Lentzea sp. NBRC 105346 TaxID=3032205 RepID=UPI0024A08BDD|nr:aldo/keto reductase [Lentzea sp. NBRC 105346]GLZ34695.1 oxidoreductase [Lentzea sp. NBRC 105346]